MQRAGVRGHFIIHRYRPCQRAMNLQIALKPLLAMPRWHFVVYFSSHFIVNFCCFFLLSLRWRGTG